MERQEPPPRRGKDTRKTSDPARRPFFEGANMITMDHFTIAATLFCAMVPLFGAWQAYELYTGNRT